MRRALFAIVLLTGCAHEPEPQAPTVLADPMQITCPEPEARTVPADLVAPLDIAAPQVQAAGAGDYGISRESVERVVTALRRCGQRLDDWRAWSTGAP